MREISGRRVLITGGAGGLGHAMARRFAAEGAELVLTDVVKATLDDMVADFVRRGVACRGYVVDVTDPAAIARLREQLHAEAGPVHVLVNNAGIVHGGPFLEVPVEKHLRTYRVNVEGVVAMTHAFLPDLVAADEGHLVNVASASGFVGLPFGSTYASSKWAVIGLAESLRLELKKLGHGHVRCVVGGEGIPQRERSPGEFLVVVALDAEVEQPVEARGGALDIKLLLADEPTQSAEHFRVQKEGGVDLIAHYPAGQIGGRLPQDQLQRA